jgi:hypothetical protein
VQGREHSERDREDNNGFYGGSGVGSEDDDDARSIRTILPHWLERVDQEDEEQFIKQQQEDEARGTRMIELGRLRTPKPMGLVMTHSQEEDIMHSSSPPSSRHSTVISELYQQLTTLLTQLEPAAQSTISALESKATSLESLIKFTQSSHVSHRFLIIACDGFLSNKQLFNANLSWNHWPAVLPSLPQAEFTTEILNNWKRSVRRN